MKRLSTCYWNFCGRILHLDVLMVLLMILVVFGGGGFVACTSEVATTSQEEVEEKTLEIAGSVLNPPVHVPEPDFVEGNSILVPGVKPEGKRWKRGAIQTFKYKNYCYMAYIPSTSGAGITQIHCDGM